VRFTSRSSRDGYAGSMLFAVVVLVVGALSVSTLLRRPLPPPARPVATVAGEDAEAPHYTGSIVIPEPGTPRCRHLLFDNVTGQIREADRRDCIEFAPSDNSTEGRLGAIRRSFAKRTLD
jgi:hypothetical protein